MRILHLSDTHGGLPKLRTDADVVVHSGDFLPNRSRIATIEYAFQPLWVEDNAKRLRDWLGERPLLVCSGNHDFCSPARLLQAVGIQAIDLDDKRVEHDGFIFHGFPYVPEFTSEWMHECDDEELTARTEGIDLKGVDVLVAHSPIFKLLDKNREGGHCGSVPMRNFLKKSTHVPRWYMHGHIHESHGSTRWVRKIDVSNAATTQRVVEL